MLSIFQTMTTVNQSGNISNGWQGGFMVSPQKQLSTSIGSWWKWLLGRFSIWRAFWTTLSTPMSPKLMDARGIITAQTLGQHTHICPMLFILKSLVSMQFGSTAIYIGLFVCLFVFFFFFDFHQFFTIYIQRIEPTIFAKGCKEAWKNFKISLESGQIELPGNFTGGLWRVLQRKQGLTGDCTNPKSVGEKKEFEKNTVSFRK